MATSPQMFAGVAIVSKTTSCIINQAYKRDLDQDYKFRLLYEKCRVNEL